MPFDQYLDEQMEALWSVSKYIHANPELNFEEVKACKVQCEFLEKDNRQGQHTRQNLIQDILQYNRLRGVFHTELQHRLRAGDSNYFRV